MGPRRLANWLGSGSGPRAAVRLRAALVEAIGARRMALVTDWCGEFGGVRTDGAVLLHGAPGTGVIIPAENTDRTCLLIGDEPASGCPESDVGWLVGELVEFRDGIRRLPAGTLQALDYDSLIATILCGYPCEIDPAAVGRCAALRVLTHTHDFAAYVGWHPVLSQYLRMVSDIVDDAETGRLLHQSGAAAGSGRW